ncbi:hypothetical protein GW932_04550 [archaeon]|nr:hypothetical protein [archaeon]
MDDSNLILLGLDLDIPNLWENDLVNNFPKSTFTIKQAYPLGDDSFSGLLKIDNANFRAINKFLLENHPLVSIEFFHPGSDLFHYLAPDKILPRVLKNTRGILSWPVSFLEKYKRVKFILRDFEVEKVIEPIEEEGIDIKKFSKVKIDFSLKEILTPKQKEILAPSLKHGYYQFPKKISLNELSRKIGVSPSTLCVHLQKIESKIMGSNGVDLFL